MAVYPGAIFRPITVNKSRWRLVPLRMNLHVAVSEASSLFGYFNSARSVPDSHFYIRRDGTIEQYVDTALIAYADLEGNGSTISVETQGGVTATQAEPWTPAQLESMARLYAWAVKTHGIARRIADDSKPGKSSHGLSWHRLGCDGNFPGRPLHGRVSGGRKYSRSFGKVCPGTAKIRQIPGIYARALNLLDGTDHGVGGITIPSTPTPERTWLDMATQKQVSDAVRGEIRDAIEDFHAALNTKFARGGQYTNGIWTSVNPVSPNTDMRGWLVSTFRKVAEVEAAQSGLIGAISALGRGEAFDEAKLLNGVRAAARAGVSDALGDIEADVTLTINKED